MSAFSVARLSRRVLLAAVLGGGVAAGALAQSVSFVEPIDGATVSSPFKVKFAVSGMDVKPAGDMSANTGHHHLLINADPIKAGESVPFDETHLHFGKGQTEAEVKLPPGTYTLTMQFANGAHQSYGPGLSKGIKVTVK
ncbi:DUF4399 domain-containing protein [Rugamonas sp. CCM 8940]|uniref:DUF4399 domain-containing protein n=1 Tax=Rugamonas sp. CCM 8940 TaxID=2765359 RepID=UPI0018F55768|nr:DUF4399 domain-containing protein [Rugamonas sp. CCM 8940]MBJ7313876.1 DUF4399 domain-containing protein [Rugamonas sp. CCM 8940]